MISGQRDTEHAIRSLNQQAESVLDPEFLRALRICDAAAVVDGPLTFLPDPAATGARAWDEAWGAWLAGPFAKTIAPALFATIEHARAGQFREIAAVDQQLGSHFKNGSAARSTSAGAKMLKRLSAARGVRWLDRFRAAVDSGATPGHFVVVYACQGALFHLSPRLVLATCAWWEWAAAAATNRRQPDAVAAFQTIAAPVFRQITGELLVSPVNRADESSRVAL